MKRPFYAEESLVTGSGRRPCWPQILGAWLFGYVPRSIADDIAQKNPGARAVGFRRGVELHLAKQRPDLSFVAAPELVGWVAIRFDEEVKR